MHVRAAVAVLLLSTVLPLGLATPAAGQPRAQKGVPAEPSLAPAASAPSKKAGAKPEPRGAIAKSPPAACPVGDLVASGAIEGHKTTGKVAALRSTTLPREGSKWSEAAGARLGRGLGSHITVDLGQTTDVRYLVIQADSRDAFTIEVSEDNKRFQALWTPGELPRQPGLRTQWHAPPKPGRGRYLRLRGRGGDGQYHVTALRAYCHRDGWPPKLAPGVDKVGWGRLDRPVTLAIKAAIGIGGAGVLWLGFAMPYRRRRTWRATDAEGPAKRSRFRRWLAGTLARSKLGATVATVFGSLDRAVAKFWGRPLRQRTWLELPVLLAAIAAIGHTFVDGRLLGLRIGGALLAAWFLLRWFTGESSRPRHFLPRLSRRITGMPGRLIYGAIGGVITAAIWFFVGWKTALGLAGALVLLLLLVRWAQSPVSVRSTATLLLAAMGLFGFVGWWNVGHFHFDHYVHIWEHYHYFVGAKYGPELRYSRIYECTAVADYLDGYGARVRARHMRRLGSDNNLGTTEEILKHPARCRSHFTPARFNAFRKDIRFFRARFSKERWDRSQTDHGYNATPVWGVAARLIADHTGDLSWEKIERLALIDSALLIAMWLAILWAFGWQATAVALIYWGCNFPARFYWNGGALLRYDWLLTLGLGLCALRKRQHFAGGVALTLSTALRVFPGLIIATLVLKAVTRMVQSRSLHLSREHARFAAGCITTIALLVPASHWSMDGLDAWGQFAENSEKHLKTALTNNMGLKTVLGYDYATRASVMRNDKKLDAYQDWKDARVYYYAKRKPLLLALIVMFVAMLAVATTRDEEDWVTACLGVGLIPIAVELTCYYYGFLLAYGLLWPRRKLPGILAAALAGLTNILNELRWNDDKYMAMSLATVIVVVVVTAHAAFARRRPRAASDEGDRPQDDPATAPPAGALAASGPDGPATVTGAPG